MEAPDRTNLLSPELCGPGPIPCSLPNTLVGDAPLLHLITRKLLEGRGGTSFTLAPPKSSPRPSLQLASVRIYKLAVAGSFPLYVWMAINPSSHSSLYTANARAARPASGTIQSSSALPTHKLPCLQNTAEGLPLAGCLPSLERQVRGKGNLPGPPMALHRVLTATLGGPYQSHTCFTVEETEAHRGQAPCDRACKGWLSSCSPLGHDSAGSLTLALVRTLGFYLCFIC